MAQFPRGARLGRLFLTLVAAVGGGATLRSQPPARPFALEEVGVAELQRRMTAGATTSRALVEQYLARIAAVDRTGPALRSIIELNPDARSIADRMDAERKAGRVRGPLHGIPVVVKDNIATGDTMRTSAGSLAMAEARAPRDAFIVARLRDAGAVLLVIVARGFNVPAKQIVSCHVRWPADEDAEIAALLLPKVGGLQ